MDLEEHQQHGQYHRRDERYRDEEAHFFFFKVSDAIRFFGREVACHMRIEAGVSHRFDQRIHIGAGGIEGHASLFGGQIDHGSDVR